MGIAGPSVKKETRLTYSTHNQIRREKTGQQVSNYLTGQLLHRSRQSRIESKKWPTLRATQRPIDAS